MNTHIISCPLHFYIAAFTLGSPLDTIDGMLDHSLAWVEASWALWDSEQHPWPPISTKNTSSHDNHRCPRHHRVSLGGRIAPFENHLQITSLHLGCLFWPLPGLICPPTQCLSTPNLKDKQKMIWLTYTMIYWYLLCYSDLSWVFKIFSY